MGLFTKSKTYVGSQFQRVIEDDKLPDSLRNGALKNLFEDATPGDQMIEYVMEELSSSVGLRAEQMYRYGKEKYIFGLPESKLYTSLAGKDASRAAIAAQVGQSVELLYYHFGALNDLHFAWQTLTNQYGYEASSNRILGLTEAKKTDVFLKDMQVVAATASTTSSLDIWGTPANAGPTPEKYLVTALTGAQGTATPYALDPAATQDYVIVSYCWVEKVTIKVEGIDVTKDVIHTETMSIQVTGFNLALDYHQAKYTTASGATGYWIYQANSNALPVVDAAFNAVYMGSGTFFPFAYFRFNKKSTVDDKTTAEYASSKKLVHYLGMDYDTIGAGINENPDIKDVETAMLMMAVPAKTTNPAEQRYLFDFFNTIQVASTGDSNNLSLPEIFGIKLNLNVETAASSIIIQDKRFKMALGYTSIVKHKVGGTIGEIGSYASGSNSTDIVVNVPTIGGGTTSLVAGTPQHWYQYQVSDGIYEEVRVYGLKMTYWIFDAYTTVGDEKNEDILMIPVDIAITKGYPLPVKEQLYSRALHYMFNSRTVVKLKWYQTGLFRAVLLIAAVVLTIVSVGQTWQAVVAAAAISATAAALVLLQIIIRQVLISIAIKLFVKVVGPKIALIAALVAAISGTAIAINAGGLAGAPWARDLLTLASGLAQGVSKQVQIEYNDLLNEKTDFEKEMESQNKLLDTAQSLLDNTHTLSPLIILGETPNDFYQRTVHSGNIGVLGIDAVTNYVDIALQLPKLSETIKESV